MSPPGENSALPRHSNERGSDFLAERLAPEQHERDLFYAEHLARYMWAATWAPGRRVLDVACGTGYGTRRLAAAGALFAAGLDRSPEALTYARTRYRGEHSPVFAQGEGVLLPFRAGAFDLVVSFETIEHLPEQGAFVGEIARVLAPSGVLLLSTPNPVVYPPGNPFHVAELGAGALGSLLKQHFRHVIIAHQSNWICSAVMPEEAVPGDGAVNPLPMEVYNAGPAFGDAGYLVALCSNAVDPPRVPQCAVLFADVQGQQAYIARMQADIALRDGLVEEYKARLTASAEAQTVVCATNAELTAVHQQHVESARMEIAKRDEVVAHYQDVVAQYQERERELVAETTRLQGEIAGLRAALSQSQREQAAAAERRPKSVLSLVLLALGLRREGSGRSSV